MDNNITGLMPSAQPNRLEQLATMFLAGQKPQQETGPKMVVAGGRVLGTDVSQPGWADKLNTSLSGIALQKRNQFFKSASDIMGANVSQDEKKNKMRQLITQHGSDYDLGIKDVLFKDMIQDTKTGEWKPQTKEEAIEFEKNKAEAKSTKYTPDEIVSIIGKLSGMSGEIPPGTTVKLGDFNIPLNPKLTQEQAGSVAAAVEVEDDVSSIKTLLQGLQGKSGQMGILAKSKLPYWMVGGKTEELKRLRDQLAARIPFAKGGKQLTPFEAKTLFTLLPQPGQELTTINRNLDKFVAEFNRMKDIAIKGTAGTRAQSNRVGKYTLVQ